jgi:hypothetical protein
MTLSKRETLHSMRADWLRVQGEMAYVRVLVANWRLRKALERSQKFNPNHDEIGRFTNADGMDSGARATGANSKPKPSGSIQLALVDPRTTAALTLLTFLYGNKKPDETPYIQFNARAFLPGASDDAAAIHVGSLSREEVDSSCPRHRLVQNLTDEASMGVTREWGSLYPKEHGTRVHAALKASVDGLYDPNLKAERSAIKSAEEKYGKVKTIRVDVIENVGDGTVCVYDIKTGRSGLTGPRMQEIADNVHSLYPGTTKLIVIETRPK